MHLIPLFSRRSLFSTVVPTALFSGCAPIELDSSDETGHSANAPQILFYGAMGASCCGEDPHPVHGTTAPDGSFILGGKSIDASGNSDGFVVKIGPTLPTGITVMDDDSNASIAWSHTFGVGGKQDAVNGTAATNDAVFIAGLAHTEKDGVSATLRKYDLNTGAQIWTTSVPADGTSLESAFESIMLTPDGGAILGGVTQSDPGGLEGFKSYGNPVSGAAQIVYYSAEQLNASTAPNTPEWVETFTDWVSIRMIRAVGDAGFVLLAATPDEDYTIVRLDPNRALLWQTALETHGEATDLTVQTHSDGTVMGFAVTGHRAINGGIDGSVTQLNINGDVRWSRHVGNPKGGTGVFAGLGSGNPKLIYDECWGIQSTASGGVVLACGTGIEGCGSTPVGSALRRECNADPRTQWRALTIELDANGDDVWYRTDSFVFPDTPEESAASAAEYVIRLDNGQTASVIDQDFGIGLIVYDAIP